ncbi:endolytic transglycosylase MltG [Aliihoeflea sp. PC F10.4]
MTTDSAGAPPPGQPPIHSRPKSPGETLRTKPGTPPPALRSRRSRSQFVIFMNFVMSCIVFATLAAGAAWYFGKVQFEGPGPSTEARTVLIQPNTGVSEIATTLQREGVITNAQIFRYGLRVYDRDAILRAGEYEVPAGASMYDIAELLKSGRSVQRALTIPEGFTVHRAFERIAAMEGLEGDMPSELPPEGSIAADTINFTRGMNRQEMIDRLSANQQRMIETIWEGRADDLPIETVEEFVTLASIVERETGQAAERPHVASVFINRLRQGMRLQSDPTFIYGIFGGEGKPSDRPIYRSDIESDTPYNTYRINGLPPGPIAIPGRAALEAVANPIETDDLYFVADGTGGHAFAQTLDEHNRNVARWRQVERERREAGEAVTDEDPVAAGEVVED